MDADFANPAAAPGDRRSNVKPTKPSVILFVALVALTLAMGLAGCAVGVGYDGPEPEWDGGLVVVEGGGYGRGYDRDRDHHAQAFHPEGGRGAAAGSARGRASMGARGGGGHR